ncbi:hypothetical protein OJJOAM_001190 [Cupriavidus sp. H18C1]
MMLYRVCWSSTASSGSRIWSTSSSSEPNTVPWPQPVVTILRAVRSSMRSTPPRVVTAADSVSQSTWIAAMSSIDSTSRWLRR